MMPAGEFVILYCCLFLCKTSPKTFILRKTLKTKVVCMTCAVAEENVCRWSNIKGRIEHTEFYTSFVIGSIALNDDTLKT